MIRTTFLCLALPIFTASAVGQQLPVHEQRPVNLLGSEVSKLPIFVSKSVVESPIKHHLGRAPIAAFIPAAAKVVPGKVRWHPTTLAATQAANKSGKPILVFQLLGKLDEEFC